MVASPSAKCTNEGRARASLGHVALGELATGKKKTRKNLQTRQGSRGRLEDRVMLNNVHSNRLRRRLIRICYSLHGRPKSGHQQNSPGKEPCREWCASSMVTRAQSAILHHSLVAYLIIMNKLCVRTKE